MFKPFDHSSNSSNCSSASWNRWNQTLRDLPARSQPPAGRTSQNQIPSVPNPLLPGFYGKQPNTKCDVNISWVRIQDSTSFWACWVPVKPSSYKECWSLIMIHLASS